MPTYRDDLLGKVFGRWTIVKNLGIRAGKHLWKARCKCGTVRTVVQNSILSGASKSCGCLKRDTDKGKLLHDYTGERIGRLIVLGQTDPMPRRWTTDRKPLGVLMRMWKVRCDCGTEKIIQTQTLRKQKETGHGSCGCWRKELNREERKKTTPPYFHYLGRIKNSAGGRGIEVSISYDELLTLIPEDGIGVCEYCGDKVTWLPYDRKNIGIMPNGNRATGHNLDRKDNKGKYSLENVVVCCGDCNRTRGDRFTYAEFMLLIPTLKKIRQERAVSNA